MTTSTNEPEQVQIPFVENGWVDPYPHDDLEHPCWNQCCVWDNESGPRRWTCQGDGCYAILRYPGECINCCPPVPDTTATIN